MNIENLEIREELILTVQEALILQAKVETIEPIVRGYQREILKEKQYQVAEEWNGRCGSESVLNPEHSYLMSDEDSEEYFELLRLKHIENGFGDLKDTRCPLMIAENKLRQARNKVFESAEYIHNIPSDRYVRLDKRDQMIELIIRMTVSYCKAKNIQLNPELECN